MQNYKDFAYLQGFRSTFPRIILFFGVVQWGERTILSHYNVTVFHLPPSANIGQYFDYLIHTGGHCPQIHPSASIRQPLIASNIADA